MFNSLHDQNAAYDLATVEIMRRVLRADSNAVDVGTHCGALLRHLVEIAPRGQHFAIEPLPWLADELRLNFPQVTVLAAAASDASGEAEFQFVENDPGYSGLRRRLYDRADPIIVPLRVPVVTLDSVLPPTLPIAFLKLDIEGGEFHALRGAQRTLDRCRPLIVFEASHRSTGEYGVTPAMLYDWLRNEFAYRIMTLTSWLEHGAPLARHEFERHWHRGPEYLFLADPGESLPAPPRSAHDWI